MRANDERSLVKRWQSGDRAAFNPLFHANREWAYRLSYRLTGSHADAKDVVQEAWLQVVRSIGQFDGRARFAQWFSRIIIRVAGHRGSRTGVAKLERLSLETEPQADAAGSDPVREAELKELDAAVRDAVDALPEDQRAALILVAIDGFSYAEAAEIVRCPQGTVAWRVAEARRKLAEKLAPYVEEAEGA